MKSLVELYRQIQLEPNSELLDKRNALIAAYVKAASPLSAIGLVRTVLGIGEPAFLEKFASHFSVKDSAYPFAGNQRETEILAQACVFDILDSAPNTTLSNLTALICRSALKYQNTEIHKTLFGKAGIYIKQSAIRDRESSEVKGTLPKIVSQKISEAEGVKIADELEKRFTAISVAFGQVVRAQELLREESDILWWVYNRVSRDLSAPFGMAVAKEAVLAGKELADVVNTFPGIANPDAFLARVVAGKDDGKKSGLPDFVNSAPAVWATEWSTSVLTQMGTQRNSLKELLPIVYALVLKTEGAGIDEWVKSISKATSFPKELTALEVSSQVYYEAMVLAVVEAEGSHV